MPTSEPTHTLGLNAGHPEEVLGVSEVGGELRQLGMQLRLNTMCRSSAYRKKMCTAIRKTSKWSVEHTSCRCLTALPDEAIDCRCVLWLLFMLSVIGHNTPYEIKRRLV